MAARKHRPVLYEVVGRSYRAHEQAPRRDPDDDVEERPVREPREAGLPPATEPRAIRFAAGRLIADLGWQGLTVAGVVALILLAIAFDAGRRYAGKAETGAPSLTDAGSGDEGALTYRDDVGPTGLPPLDIDGLDRGQQPAEAEENTARTPERSSRETSAAPSSAFTPQTGVYYVAVQHFPKNRLEDAKKAGAFLMANGVDCIVVPRPDEIRLIATQPFATEQASELLRARIRQLGKRYRAEKQGGYDFAGCYPLLLKPR